jgi:4-hydroxybenzoyl-CoA thioesterase
MRNAVFSRDRKIRFSHSDPAGIVYYPNYFDMFNGVVEDWFEALGHDIPTQISRHRRGFPTVRAECDFFVPSRMGDTITFTLRLAEIGRSSLKLVIHGHAAGVERLRATLILVVVSQDSGKSITIPDEMRTALSAYREASQDWSMEKQA